MATDGDKKSRKLLLLKWSSRDQLISKKTTTNKKKNGSSSRMIRPTLSKIHGKVRLAQFLKGSTMKEGGSICKCGLFIDPAPNNLPICRYCLKFDRDPMTGLPKFFVLNRCCNCGKYYSGPDSCHQTSPQSPELLNLLTRLLQHDIFKFKLVLLSAHFSHSTTVFNNNSIKINVTVHMQTPTGDKLERICAVEYLVRVLECQLCRLMGPTRPWNSAVQLRPYGSRFSTNRQQPLLKLVDRVLMITPRNQAVNLRISDQGVDVFFPEQRCARRFIVTISMLTPTAIQNTFSLDNQSYSPVSICLIRKGDLVFLPSRLEDLGPLVICTKVNGPITLNGSMSITLLDPLILSECVLSAQQYWDSPFEAVKSRDELVEFVVLKVRIVFKFIGYSFANVEVARLSDSGQNDITFSVKSHLGDGLNPGDVALGYDLRGLNITGGVVLPDVVLIEKKDDKLTRNLEKKNIGSEFFEFLRDLENNPEAMFNLSLNNNGKGTTTDMNMAALGGVGENVGLDLEKYLASLGLSDDEDGDPILKE